MGSLNSSPIYLNDSDHQWYAFPKELVSNVPPPQKKREFQVLSKASRMLTESFPRGEKKIILDVWVQLNLI